MDKADAGAGGPGWLWLWRGSLWCSRWWQVSLPAVCQPWPAASCESGRGEWGQLGSERAAIQQAREMLWDLREQADVWPGWVRINFQKLQLTWSKFFSGDVRGNFSSFCCLLLSLYTNTSLHTLLHNMILFLTWFEKKKQKQARYPTAPCWGKQGLWFLEVHLFTPCKPELCGSTQGFKLPPHTQGDV